MREAVRVVREEFGGAAPSMMALASRVGPHGSLQFGYRIIHRAIRAGMLRVDSDHPDAAKKGMGAIVEGDRA